ncbi:MAG: hypothetical protein AAFN07_14375 [Pseudomonadota bacterium]
MKATKIIAILATVAVLAAIAGGLYLLGGPGKWRNYKEDRMRLSDIRRIQNSISGHFYTAEALPESLEDTELSNEILRDPVTGKRYEYEAIDTRRYRLCAVFSEASRAGVDSTSWQHPKGRHCFKLEALDNR